MYWAPIRMKCKGSAECSMLYKNLKPESNHLDSAIQNLSHAHMTAHILTPPPALLQILSRSAFSLQNIIKTQSWSFGEGNGNPLQYSCLDKPIDGGAW